MPTYRKSINELDIQMAGVDRLAYRCLGPQFFDTWVDARFYQNVPHFDDNRLINDFIVMFYHPEYEVGILMPDSETE